jgi:DtxR family Mn-dependent transcriptional regulator
MGRGHGHSIEEYLEVIYFLVSPIGEYQPDDGSGAIAARVADMLGVSGAAVGEMLKRLTRDGLIERGEGRELRLTNKGRELAEQAVRRHRIVERLLTDFLGYSAAEAHVHADEIGDSLSNEMVDRIHERLGRPDRCPHGWPVEPAAEAAENAELTTLADLAEGVSCEIVRLVEHDGELLHWFYDEGLEPGAKLRVSSIQSAVGQLKVMRAGASDDEQVVTNKAARGLIVRAA